MKYDQCWIGRRYKGEYQPCTELPLQVTFSIFSGSLQKIPQLSLINNQRQASKHSNVNKTSHAIY